MRNKEKGVDLGAPWWRPRPSRERARPPPERDPIILVIPGHPISSAEAEALCVRARALLIDTRAGLVCDVSRVVHPDASTVNALARLRLLGCRLDRRVDLYRAGSDLRELIDLMGLTDVFPVVESVETRRQTE